MFGGHDVMVQIGDPLSAASGQIEVGRRLAEMHRYAVPIEAGELLDQIGGGCIAKLPVGAGACDASKP